MLTTFTSYGTVPLHRQAELIRTRRVVQPDGELRWIMGDVRLESRQLTDWHPLFPPRPQR